MLQGSMEQLEPEKHKQQGKNNLLPSFAPREEYEACIRIRGWGLLSPSRMSDDYGHKDNNSDIPDS